MPSLTRRAFLRAALTSLPLVVVGCRQQVVEVERLIEKEVTKLVRETVIVSGTPEIIERTVEMLVTPTPSPREGISVVADVTSQSWSQFAMLMSPSFEEMFPSIRIEWRSVSDWGVYPEVVATAQASGQIADLLEVPIGPLLGNWAERNTIRTLDDVVAADGFDTSGFLQGPLSACRHRQELVGLPFIGHSGDSIVAYDEALLGQAELPSPTGNWTLDDLRSTATAFTAQHSADRRVSRFGYGETLSLPSAFPLLHAHDAYLFSQDAQSCALGDAQGLAALRWIYDLVHSGNASPAPAQVEGGLLTMFGAGKLAMLRLDLRGLLQVLPLLEPDRQIGSAILPEHPASGKIGTLAAGMAYCLGGDTSVPNEAFQWIKFACGREMGVQMFLGGYGEPGARKASWTDPRVVREQPICAQVALVADVAEAERLPESLDVLPFYQAWERRVHALRAGQSTPEDAAESLCAEIEAALLRRPAQL
ncbi:MAG: extracellular solute-binding protein [Anaerolineae bacterium]